MKQITYYKLYDKRGKWIAVEYNLEDTEARVADHPTWTFAQFKATVPDNFKDSRG